MNPTKKMIENMKKMELDDDIDTHNWKIYQQLCKRDAKHNAELKKEMREKFEELPDDVESIAEMEKAHQNGSKEPRDTSEEKDENS